MNHQQKLISECACLLYIVGMMHTNEQNVMYPQDVTLLVDVSSSVTFSLEFLPNVVLLFVDDMNFAYV